MHAGRRRTRCLPGGEAPASWTLGQHVTEIALHTWDIAVATGQLTDLDPVDGAAALEWGRANLLPGIRGEHVGPEVAVAATAPMYVRLAAVGGRAV